MDLCRTYYTRNCILQDTDWSKVQAEIAKIAGELHVCTRTIAFTLWLFFLAGIVETGLFVGMASKVYFGNADGTVLTK